MPDFAAQTPAQLAKALALAIIGGEEIPDKFESFIRQNLSETYQRRAIYARTGTPQGLISGAIRPAEPSRAAAALELDT